MAERVLVTPEEMLQTMQVYNTQKAAQSTAFNSMLNAVNTLASAWTGVAFDTFRQQFTQFHNNLKMSEAKMQDAVDELRASSEIFQSAEEKNRTAAAGLDIGTSPFSV